MVQLLPVTAIQEMVDLEDACHPCHPCHPCHKVMSAPALRCTSSPRRVMYRLEMVGNWEQLDKSSLFG
jgi:hypothetical protein